MHEAKMEETEHGLVAADDGWWIANVADLRWDTIPGNGTYCSFEAPGAPSKVLGIGLHLLPPGETPGMYHWESNQEGFLLLSGEALVVVEGEERRMRQWDYFHCPPGTAHITIGAEGDEPCVFVMVGTRDPDRRIHYPVDPVAAGHGASVDVATDDPRETYRDRPPGSTAPAPWPPRG